MWIITTFIELETILRFKGREPFVSDFRYNLKFNLKRCNKEIFKRIKTPKSEDAKSAHI